MRSNNFNSRVVEVGMRFIITKEGAQRYRLTIRNREFNRELNRSLGTFKEPLDARNFLLTDFFEGRPVKVLWFGDLTEIDPFYIGYTEDDLDLDVSNPEGIFGPRLWTKRPNRGMQKRRKD